MSMFRCEVCNKLLDGDEIESFPSDIGLICIDCLSDLPAEEIIEIGVEGC